MSLIPLRSLYSNYIALYNAVFGIGTDKILSNKTYLILSLHRMSIFFLQKCLFLSYILFKEQSSVKTITKNMLNTAAIRNSWQSDPLLNNKQKLLQKVLHLNHCSYLNISLI